MIQAIKNEPMVIFPILCILALLIFACAAIVSSCNYNKITQDVEKFCQDNGYLGTDFVYKERVCYGYVEGNQLIIVPVDELKER